MKLTGIIWPVLLLLTVQKMHAQGCSDAGVCSINAVKDNTISANEPEAGSNTIKTGPGYAKGERGIDILTWQFEYTRQLSNTFEVSAKINFISSSGELAKTNGLGDLFLSFSHAFSKKRNWQLSVLGGLKLPLSNADKSKNGIQLPMPYQISLGTTDLLLGVSARRNSFGATLAYQQPLNSNNKNKFLQTDYPPASAASKYLSTNNFSRKADVVARFSYNVKTGKQLSIIPGLLGIYHTANDSYANSTSKVEIINSRGLTLNGILVVRYQFNKKCGFEFSAGSPFVVREKRPDGLTRKFVTSLEYFIRF